MGRWDILWKQKRLFNEKSFLVIYIGVKACFRENKPFVFWGGEVVVGREVKWLVLDSQKNFCAKELLGKLLVSRSESQKAYPPLV